MHLKDIFSRKTQQPQVIKTAPDENRFKFKETTDWNMVKSAMETSHKLDEPVTLARERLMAESKDFGSAKGLKMYNSHRTKLQNQWLNPFNNINTGFSTVQWSMYNYQSVNYYECYALAQDPLFAMIFNILSQTPFAKGGKIDGIDDEEAERLNKGNAKYKVDSMLQKAVRSNYVSGGCLIYMDFGLDNLEEPLDLSKVDMRRFKGFRHIDPINCVAVEVNTIDPAKADYMEPEKWYVIGLGVAHQSHFLKFEANVQELVMKPLTMYFGMPLTQLIKADIANASIASQSMVNYLKKMRMTYLKTNMTNFTTSGIVNFKNRLEAMSLLQDSDSVFAIQQDEDVIQHTSALTGFADCVKLALQLVGAKTSIPATKLMGDSPSGLNATGEGDLKNFYDTIRNIQFEIKDNILKIEGIIGGLEDGKFRVYENYIFNPLEESNERERAENLRSYVEVARALTELGVKNEDVLDWLKGFKEFNLGDMEIDMEAPEGMMDYDNPQDDYNMEKEDDKQTDLLDFIAKKK